MTIDNAVNNKYNNREDRFTRNYNVLLTIVTDPSV